MFAQTFITFTIIEFYRFQSVACSCIVFGYSFSRHLTIFDIHCYCCYCCCFIGKHCFNISAYILHINYIWFETFFFKFKERTRNERNIYCWNDEIIILLREKNIDRIIFVLKKILLQLFPVIIFFWTRFKWINQMELSEANSYFLLMFLLLFSLLIHNFFLNLCSFFSSSSKFQLVRFAISFVVLFLSNFYPMSNVISM